MKTIKRICARFRRTPTLLMQEGRILAPALKKTGITLQALAAAARKKGYFNLADIDLAVLETDGSISFLPQPMKRPLNAKDFNFAPLREGWCYPVAVYGVLQPDGLRAAGFSESKLLAFFNERGYALSDILLATINEAGRVDVFLVSRKQ